MSSNISFFSGSKLEEFNAIVGSNSVDCPREPAINQVQEVFGKHLETIMQDHFVSDDSCSSLACSEDSLLSSPEASVVESDNELAQQQSLAPRSAPVISLFSKIARKKTWTLSIDARVQTETTREAEGRWYVATLENNTAMQMETRWQAVLEGLRNKGPRTRVKRQRPQQQYGQYFRPLLPRDRVDSAMEKFSVSENVSEAALVQPPKRRRVDLAPEEQKSQQAVQPSSSVKPVSEDTSAAQSSLACAEEGNLLLAAAPNGPMEMLFLENPFGDEFLDDPNAWFNSIFAP